MEQSESTRCLSPSSASAYVSPFLDPERLVEPVPQGGGALPQADRELGIVPDVVGELSRPEARVVGVPLHLGGGDGRRGKPPVAEAL